MADDVIKSSSERRCEPELPLPAQNCMLILWREEYGSSHIFYLLSTNRRFIQKTTIMSSSNPPATVAATANHAATQAQAESVIKLFEFEEDSKSKSANIPSSSPQEDSFALFGIHDSLTLKKYKNIQKLVRDDFFDGDQLDMIDIEQEVNKAMEAEHDADLASCPLSGSSPRRRGERRGQPHSPAEPTTTTSESLIVMTKTHDGSSRDRGTSDFIVIHNPSEVGSSFHNASAA